MNEAVHKRRGHARRRRATLRIMLAQAGRRRSGSKRRRIAAAVRATCRTPERGFSGCVKTWKKNFVVVRIHHPKSALESPQLNPNPWGYDLMWLDSICASDGDMAKTYRQRLHSNV